MPVGLGTIANLGQPLILPHTHRGCYILERDRIRAAHAGTNLRRVELAVFLVAREQGIGQQTRLVSKD